MCLEFADSWAWILEIAVIMQIIPVAVAPYSCQLYKAQELAELEEYRSKKLPNVDIRVLYRDASYMTGSQSTVELQDNSISWL